jgi:ribonuclease P protein component
MVKRFGLPKTEKLKSRKRIDTLFAQGKGFAVFPIRVTYQFTTAQSGTPLQVGFTASKRSFKKAVDRNRIKRLLREAYRLQKEELQMGLEAAGKNGTVFFLYTGKTLPEFEAVKTAMAKWLKKLSVIASSENPV